MSNRSLWLLSCDDASDGRWLRLRFGPRMLRGCLCVFVLTDTFATHAVVENGFRARQAQLGLCPCSMLPLAPFS